METIIIKSKNKISFFQAIICLLFSALFIPLGLDFSTIKCANSSCEIKIEFSILSNPNRKIDQIEKVFLHEKKSSGIKSSSIVSNVILKSKNNEILVFNSYTNVSTSAKEEVLKDLKSFLNKEVNTINKTYGGINIGFYLGILSVLVCFYVLYILQIKVKFPFQIIINNKELSVRNRHTKNQHLFKYSDIDEIKLAEGNEALKYRYPILHKYEVTIKNEISNSLFIVLNNKKVIDIGGLGYKKEILMEAKNKLEALKN